MLLRLALPTPLYRSFDYLCPSECLVHGKLPAVGSRALAPFGKKQLVGIIIAHINATDSDVPASKLRPIIDVLDDTPILSAQMLDFAGWLARYYHYPLGDTLSVMLPALISQGKPIHTPKTLWQRTSTPADGIAKSAKKQLACLELFCALPDGVSDTDLRLANISSQTLKALQDKGLIQKNTLKTTPNAPPTAQVIGEVLPPNDEQRSAIDTITQAIDAGNYQGILLHGITGSGKTEVYLQAMAHALAAGKQVLILVPEIGLTPQTKSRFGSRFAANICVLHSGLNDSERLAGWADCLLGQAQIIIGTRSSVLYPFANLGLIIIDEAHDGSYKQQDHLRYHACDVALWRGLTERIPVVLGTATPSLEQLKLAQNGKLHQCKLTKRAGAATLAQMQLIDIRQSTRAVMHQDGQAHDTTLGDDTVRQMRECLARGEQVLVFINRRGYAPILLCDACGWQADCPNCDAHLTLHKGHYTYLKCHHCGHQTAPPHACPECNSANLINLGLGTSKLAEHLHALFANPQISPISYPIVQIDRDTMRKKGAWERTYAQILTGAPMILVGTQMIAKGHHFPNVTLVVISDADAGLLSPDFRSPEHTAQRIIQVAGRAGRADKAGRVLIQTRQPDNPLLTTLVCQGYDAFAQNLLKERQMLGLPPFAHAALIRAESHDVAKARTAIAEIGKNLPKTHDIATISTDAPMAKKGGRYHVQFLLLAKNRKSLHALLDAHWLRLIDLPSVKAVKISLDIDPLGW
ncbi:primosomal protein N' [Moraxella caviae]|uniref:Replication restart protein PriA n=1 Tax=Moraxella caviae TaxID=34060 RepID=A0A1T0A124_9GAMM|nr:primosomal protein N' [Moraxella caviae]OOR89430.1 primosomal protein N' [Moraxella caviae]STZ09846.1 Primosomal protein N' [Moraxella caviae]VEW13078.1 Primosomal protein N' [Moraxella caviae]